MSEHVFAPSDDGSLRFVGNFDALYREKADPWSQSGMSGPMREYYRQSRLTLASALILWASGKGLEIGCGHGHLTRFLDQRLRRRVSGLDVSPAAIEAARKHYPQVSFFVGDVTAENFDPPGRFGFVVWAQCWWYLLHRIDTAVENTLRCIEPGGMLVVSQAFLRGEQRYGREVADGFHGALRLMLERFGDRLRLVEARYDDSDRYVHHDGMMVFRRSSHV